MKIYKPYIADFATSNQFWKHAEDFLIDNIFDISAEHGFARIALSGGNTPIPLYQQLAKNTAIEWDRVEIYQTDERYVDKDDQDSNQANIVQFFDETILDNIRSLNLFDTSLDYQACRDNYQDIIDSLDEPYFDICILGIGPDGHFASLFPNQSYLSHQDENVLTTTAPSDFAVAKRLSLSIETILSSRKLIVLLKGDDKFEVLEELLEGEKSASEFPAKFLLAHPSLHIFTCFS